MENTSSQRCIPDASLHRLLALLADGACDDWADITHASGTDENFRTIAFVLHTHEQPTTLHDMDLGMLLRGLASLLNSEDPTTVLYAQALASLLYKGQTEFITDEDVSALAQSALFQKVIHPVGAERSF